MNGEERKQIERGDSQHVYFIPRSDPWQMLLLSSSVGLTWHMQYLSLGMDRESFVCFMVELMSYGGAHVRGIGDLTLQCLHAKLDMVHARISVHCSIDEKFR